MNRWHNEIMVNSVGLKLKAVSLRKQGKSYQEINRLLKIPKSTLSTWLKDIPLSEKVKNQNVSKAKIIWAKNITAFNKQRSKKYQKDTQLLIKNFARQVPKISDRNLYFIGLALFWAEGGKREKWNVKFVNSDQFVVKGIMQFFRKICRVADEKFTLRIHLYPNITEKDARQFWSQVTKLPLTQFRKSQYQISKSSKHRRPSNRLPYGTLHITIGDASLNKKLKGWLLGLSQQFK